MSSRWLSARAVFCSVSRTLVCSDEAEFAAAMG